MTVNLEIGFLTVIIFVILGTSDTYGDEQVSTVKHGDLELSISTDKKIYNEGEAVHVSWIATNIGNEALRYVRNNSCASGFGFKIIDYNGEMVNAKLSANALLIDENDLRATKFENLESYASILNSIIVNPDKEETILIFTQEKDRLGNLLLSKHRASKTNLGTNYGSLTVSLPVSEIPKITEYEEVRTIMIGDTPICMMAEFYETLSPNESLMGGFSWSQLIKNRETKMPQRVPEGRYMLETTFNSVKACTTIEIVGIQEKTLKEVSCDAENSDSLTEIDKEKLVNENKRKTCNEDRVLLLRNNGDEVCVFSKSVSKLLQRGWEKVYQSTQNEENVPLFETKIKEFEDGELVEKSYYFYTKEEADYFKKRSQGEAKNPDDHVP